ncbi:hypothetical protein EDD63_14915 [Breznakia blatticola]|uniref:Uncharacterized protein n=1 Tax=Breznakia blatticola TaxID=1754012 RepID=A0A4R7Z9S2_9FIRM|nr:hypothetical protein [Breznakia blatticola]TDW13125.1 hypothetical protein EDD63_14915 [Breznakia blatticola]
MKILNIVVTIGSSLLITLLITYFAVNLKKKQKLKFDIFMDIFSKVFISVIMILVAVEANTISEQQYERDMKESSPIFEITRNNDFAQKGFDETYKLTNSKGIAQYVDFSRIDTVEFYYHDMPVHMTIINANEENIKYESKENEWYYIPKTQNISTKSMKELFERKVKEKTDENTDVYFERYYKVSFVDYKNEKFTFYFIESDDEYILKYTDEESYNNKISFLNNEKKWGGGMMFNNKNENVESRVDQMLVNIEKGYDNMKYIEENFSGVSY